MIDFTDIFKFSVFLNSHHNFVWLRLILQQRITAIFSIRDSGHRLFVLVRLKKSSVTRGLQDTNKATTTTRNTYLTTLLYSVCQAKQVHRFMQLVNHQTEKYYH